MKNVAQAIATQGFPASIDFRRMFHDPIRLGWHMSLAHGFITHCGRYTRRSRARRTSPGHGEL